MLVLSRKIGERIIIEPGIEIAVVEIRGSRVRIGVDAPRDVQIRRSEVAEGPGGQALAHALESDSV